MKKVGIEDLSSSIINELQAYQRVTSEKVKDAVKKAGQNTRKEISETAPKNTGKYGKSWAVKNLKETSDSLHIVVHSKTKYQLAHLLEHGHARRGGGRVSARPHIAAAEENGIKAFEEEIKEVLQNG